MQQDSVATVARWIEEAKGDCLAFTGAGMSTGSGIPAFRGSGGVWERFPPERFGSPLGLLQSFVSDLGRLREFLYSTASTLLGAQPAESHRALAALEARGLLNGVVTQNVDGLHELAGSQEVISLHGNFFHGRCGTCGATTVFAKSEIESFVRRLTDEGCGRLEFLRVLHRHRLRCERCGAATRPDMVLFGEQVPARAYERAASAAESCKLLLAIGTSVIVRPASDIPYIALHSGAQVVEVNTERTELSPLVDLRVDATADTFLPALLEHLAVVAASG